jgi:hypothetical protein
MREHARIAHLGLSDALAARQGQPGVPGVALIRRGGRA